MTICPSVLVTPAADSPLTPWPAAARSEAVGGGRGGRVDAEVMAEVAAVSPKGLYLAVPEDRQPAVIPIVTADALALPTAVRLGRRSGEIAWTVRIGDRVTVSARRTPSGLLCWGADLPDQQIRVVRRWTPSRVARVPRNPHQDRRFEAERGFSAPKPTHLGGLVGSGIGEVATDRVSLAESVAHAVGAADPSALVRDLVGRGPGLTPSGDDALAGALLVLHGLGLSGGLAAIVRDHLSRTTALSASLLVAAMDGYAAPPVVALVDAVLAGGEDSEGVAGAVASARHTVEAIGHWSGRDLIAGIAGALSALSATPVTASPAPWPAALSTTALPAPTGLAGRAGRAAVPVGASAPLLIGSAP